MTGRSQSSCAKRNEATPEAHPEGVPEGGAEKKGNK